MSTATNERSRTFRQLHRPGQLLLLPNAWDPGSARLIESAGAAAIATTSSGVAWARGYPDGDKLPTPILAATVGEIVRVLSVPLTVDCEGGYSAEPERVGEVIGAVAEAGAVGVNLEDGSSPPDLLCAKIEAAKRAADRAGVDLFVNARTDVFLRGLVPREAAVEETVARARRYRDAGCDGIFVPRASEASAIRALVAAIDLPLNLMVVPDLPPVAELRQLGVRRVSSGSALAQAAYATVRRGATMFLEEGRYEAMFEAAISYPELNALFATV